MPNDQWRDQAACRDKNPLWWFPPESFGTSDGHDRKRETPRLYREARRICLTCPVRQECLDYALEARECCGMWGALTRPERHTILRERRRDARLQRTDA